MHRSQCSTGSKRSRYDDRAVSSAEGRTSARSKQKKGPIIGALRNSMLNSAKRYQLPSLFAAAEQQQQHDEQGDEVEVQAERTHDRSLGGQLCVTGNFKVAVLDPLRVVGGEPGEHQHTDYGNHELQRRRLQEEVDQETRKVSSKNLIMGYAILGAIVTPLIAACVALLRGSVPGVIIGLLFGLLVGGALGAAGGYANQMVTERFIRRDMEVIFHAMTVHGAGWALIGIATAVSSAAALRDGRMIFSFLVGALGAVAVATVLYPILSTVMFPMSQPQLAVPQPADTRMLWAGMTVGLMGSEISMIRRP